VSAGRLPITSWEHGAKLVLVPLGAKRYTFPSIGPNLDRIE